MEGERLEEEQPEGEPLPRTFADHAPGAHGAGDLARKRRDLLKRYGVALGLAALALFLRGVLPFREGTAIYQLPLVAVLLSAWYGGRGPGLLASAICITGVLYWFVPPVKSFEISADHALPFSIFIALCLLVTQFSAGRRRAEQALRASEERFRALVQFSFDVYWETDARHRFTRQEFSERLSDAPGPGSEIGKTRWEVPYLEPDEDGWRKHRATLDAHLPFRDFELARPTPDGGKRYVSVSGMPAFDEAGRFAGYRGVGRHITGRKLAEAEHRAHVWFLESMDRINRAMQGTNDLEQMMGDVLDAVLQIFAADRAWLLYPCDPDAPSWRPVMERTRPQYPGAAARGRDLPMTGDAAEVARTVLGSSGALPAGPGHERQVKPEIASHFGVQSEMLMALRPKSDRPYLFGLHQCSRERAWTADEQRLFEEIGHRLADALSSLIAFRSLRESERRLEAAQRLAHAGWWERDYATGHVSLSDEACRIFGVQPVDLPDWDGRWRSLIHPEDRDKAAAASEMALAGGARYDVEYRVVRPDGGVRVVHSQGDVTRDESGRPVRQFGVMQDITELRRAEDELRASQARLEEAQRVAHLGYWERDLAANRVVLAEESWRIFGIPPQERTADLAQWRSRWLALIHPEDRPRVLAAVTAALAGGPRYDVEFRIIRANGEMRVVHSQGDVIRDASGRPCRMFGTQQDITELRRAEQEVRARQDMLDLAQKAARAVAFDWYIGARESENRWSPELEAMYGLEPGTFDRTYQGWKKLVHPDDWPSVKRAIDRANQSGDIDAEYRIVHKDAAVRWLHAKGRMFFDAERRPERMVGFMIDVTDRRQAEEELRAAETRFRTFVDHAMDAFFLHDEQLRLVDVNRQACQSLGYAREELVGMHPREFDATLDEAAITRLAQRARAGEKLTFETRHRRKDGTLFPVEIRTGMFRQGEKLFYLALARDISERKLVEATLRDKDHALQSARDELARVSRVTMMGELTAAIAHEVNQPLGAMVANAAACTRWLAADPPQTAKARRALESIAADGRRASEIIGRIRALVKRQAPRKDLVDVNLKVAQVIELAADEVRRNGIVLRTELAEGLPRVEGDRVQLQQVLLNLILNAIDAMSPIGDRDRELTIVSRRDGPQAVLVEVRDTGPGLDPERAAQVFEPFYTTKSHGLGIGLSISRSIVEAHGGQLWVNPNQPHGAIFRFSLPVGEAAP
jgi:PAS domain S-box-containing protein